MKTDYPFSTDIVYEYENDGNADNALGKIRSVTDETGTTAYSYGLLGETVREERKIPSSSILEDVTAVTEYRSNYLGQMQHIVYPDGEKVAYGYDAGGNVESVTGTKPGRPDFDYVTDIGYDEYGQRVHISYGNGVTTDYTYDAERRWLSNVLTENDRGREVQNLSYKFDLAGNATSRTDTVDSWSVSHDYTYDGLYQLTKASGRAVNTGSYADAGLAKFDATYTQSFTFSGDGRNVSI